MPCSMDYVIKLRVKRNLLNIFTSAAIETGAFDMGTVLQENDGIIGDEDACDSNRLFACRTAVFVPVQTQHA